MEEEGQAAELFDGLKGYFVSTNPEPTNYVLTSLLCHPPQATRRSQSPHTGGCPLTAG